MKKMDRIGAFLAGMMLVFLVDDLTAHNYVWSAIDGLFVALSAVRVGVEYTQKRRALNA